jgi:hypothetical protein
MRSCKPCTMLGEQAEPLGEGALPGAGELG